MRRTVGLAKRGSALRMSQPRPVAGRRQRSTIEDEDEDGLALRAIRGGGRSGRRLRAWLEGRRRR
jgi:hypothetical protein